MVKTIMEQLETDPVPLGTSHIPSHIPPRRCGGLCFKRPCASRRGGVTHHTNERARETSTTAPPCLLPTHSTRGTGRAIANEPCFVSRVVVVVVSSAVVGRVFGSSTEEPNGGRHRDGK